ncbi:hypothetical protein H5410_016082 [Solanum commersonii]|uniref:Uncharacterized protein n=1 Tax=Solanum commersonii TaxID=4109 RepID=A0A9J5ZWC0_SOLCO|nr:hypothetical protein H5410_016082 [Solanum commersonii]
MPGETIIQNTLIKCLLSYTAMTNQLLVYSSTHIFYRSAYRQMHQECLNHPLTWTSQSLQVVG